MTVPVTIVLLGNPTAQGMPRLTEGVAAYTPAKTRDALTTLRVLAHDAHFWGDVR